MNGEVCAQINLSALHHNFLTVRSLAPHSKILAMVKADAYGHGLIRIAKALSEADGFGVAAIEEAISLREAGISQPIFIMSRFDHSDQVALCLKHQLTVVIHQPYQIEILERAHLSAAITVWLKLETGMHRLGLLPDQLIDAWQRLQRIDWIQKPIGLMTHLACADTPKHLLNTEQIQLFEKLTKEFPGPKSVANSAAIFSNCGSLYDWVRPGIMLYGASPLLNQTAEQLGLKPVMTLTSHLNAVRFAKKGDWVGYGATQQCPEDMLLGVVAAGYGDGYPRHARSGTPVLIQGQRCPLMGRVSMDMITVDLGHAPNAKVGDPVVLWGEGLPAEQIATYADTIAYELFCHVTRRVKFNTYE
ncbi:MAG: alanine racemase [Proteobacteria bacterium]|nr:alanine racemase [Pseudomonadota bacterium]